MAGRPYKIGLDYFPIDIGIAEDQAVAYVEAKYGVIAFGILIKLLIKIYRSGYYTTWTERDQYLFLKHTNNVDINTLREIISAYINSGFFNKPIFDKHQVLTSHGIQKRYIMACERRTRISLCQPYACIVPNDEDFPTNNVCLIPLSADANAISADIMSTEIELMSAKDTYRKGKERKEEESKGFPVSVYNNPLQPQTTHPTFLKNRNGQRPLFDKVVGIYPKEVEDGDDAITVFFSLFDAGVLTESSVDAELIPGIERWKASGDWLDENGKWIPGLAKFLDKRRWLKMPRRPAVDSQRVYQSAEDFNKQQDAERAEIAARYK